MHGSSLAPKSLTFVYPAGSLYLRVRGVGSGVASSLVSALAAVAGTPSSLLAQGTTRFRG